MVDSALVSVLKMRVELHEANGLNGTLAEFKKNQKLVDYYEGKFEVHMGFGLHIGWAIEGAIGSTYKIDASYLSPNVNMAARLEAATHQFGCPMLVSGPFVNEMSPPARALCRKIDVVTVKGSQVPLELWTCDINNKSDDDCLKCVVPVIENGQQQPINFDLVKGVQKDFSREFKEVFERGVKQYVDGDWKAAKEFIDKALTIYGEDGPANSLMRVLQKQNFEAPKTWSGFRELTSK
jgi:hypothetical protein